MTERRSFHTKPYSYLFGLIKGSTKKITVTYFGKVTEIIDNGRSWPEIILTKDGKLLKTKIGEHPTTLKFLLNQEIKISLNSIFQLPEISDIEIQNPQLEATKH